MYVFIFDAVPAAHVPLLGAKAYAGKGRTKFELSTKSFTVSPQESLCLTDMCELPSARQVSYKFVIYTEIVDRLVFKKCDLDRAIHLLRNYHSRANLRRSMINISSSY